MTRHSGRLPGIPNCRRHEIAADLPFCPGCKSTRLLVVRRYGEDLPAVGTLPTSGRPYTCIRRVKMRCRDCGDVVLVKTYPNEPGK